jgi:hypothetical protein
MSELVYALSVFYALIAIALAGFILLAIVEAVYFIYCKIRGLKY